MNLKNVVVDLNGTRGAGRSLLLKFFKRVLSNRGVNSKIDPDEDQHILHVDMDDRAREEIGRWLDQGD